MFMVNEVVKCNWFVHFKSEHYWFERNSLFFLIFLKNVDFEPSKLQDAHLWNQERCVDEMKKGAVIVDLAASTGGNCEVTENGKVIDYNGITIIGDSNLPGSIPKDASFMFSKNIVNFLKLLIKEGQANLNMEDDIIAATCITHQGEINSARLKK